MQYSSIGTCPPPPLFHNGLKQSRQILNISHGHILARHKNIFITRQKKLLMGLTSKTFRRRKTYLFWSATQDIGRTSGPRRSLVISHDREIPALNPTSRGLGSSWSTRTVKKRIISSFNRILRSTSLTASVGASILSST